MKLIASPCLAMIAAAAALWTAAPAQAQVGVSGAVASDLRFRGLSLTDGRPAITLGAAYDHASGFYVGGAAMAQNTYHDGLQLLGFRENLGFAFRQARGPSWDIGVDNEDLSQYGAARRSLHYSEVYAGVSAHGVAAHLYYSANYFKSGYSTLYTELSGAMRPADDWRLFGSVGALNYISSPPGQGGQATRYDARVGVARQLGAFELKLEGTLVTPIPAFQAGQSPTAAVVSASYFF